MQGFIALTRDGRYQEALELFKRDHPFPGVCGRVCDHPCEEGCTRNSVDAPLRIMDIHRFLADRDMADGKPHVPAKKAQRGEKIAIVGAGPAGLTCAYFLAIEGYAVTVFEKLDVLGGMLTVGIPEYRLPRDVTRAEIQVVKELGVEFQTGVEIGKDVTIGELRRQGYKAFFIGIGAHECRHLNIEGENCEGVYPGVEYLRDINLGGRIDLGDRVAVIGGGNVAMDAVRTAIRTGAKNPFIIYRRSVEEMPTHAEEIEECRQEGIELMTLTHPTRIISENGKVCGIECMRMELGQPDESGRRRPVPIEGSGFTIEVDSVIPAIGQEIQWSCLTDECACSLSEWGTMQVDKTTLQTNDPDIFAGGDAVTGPSTVVAAVGAGKQAAISIDRFVRGEDLYAGRGRQWIAMQDAETGDIAATERAPIALRDPETRITNFDEVRLGLDEDAVHAEINRCLQCGGCCECYACVSACRAEAVTVETHTQKPETFTIEAGAVILNSGFKPFDPSGIDFYGYKKIPDVVTSLEYERMLSAGGPFQGHLKMPSNGMEPRSVAWIQCVGSRNTNSCDNEYCSGVCCMYAIKQAVITDAHLPEGGEQTIFYMDIRTHGKEFERYYQYAVEQNVRFIRARPHTIHPGPDNSGVCLVYVTENGRRVVENFDMAVLSIGMEAPSDAAGIAQSAGIELTENHFAKTGSFNPGGTTRDGIYIGGSFAGPMNIPESVAQASSAAAAASRSLAPAKNTLTREKKYPPEKNIAGQEPRIGVFVCSCGVNIANTIDVAALVEYALSLPNVVFAENNMFTCSTDTQNMMAKAVEENSLNRIVVAACSPRTHEPLFQDTLKEVGL
ncbi:MAG: FAD-dependent oxidoreductase, partial [Desulfobacterales bacterium]|nr:FAD-dependent oxidoreductase [Desulfobacterales bacterium]